MSGEGMVLAEEWRELRVEVETMEEYFFSY